MSPAAPRRPNLIFILSDDHAAHAISAYGSRVNRTPHLDRIAAEGARFDACLCTNSICTPSRASILTGSWSHVNGATTLNTPLDNTIPTFITQLGAAGYQTAVFGKWHLGHGPGADPAGFDTWRVLPDQGDYHDPDFLDADGRRSHPGYATDLITDFSLDWLADRDPERPFCLLVHHKAPHRPWDPDAAHADAFPDPIAEPDTLFDELAGRGPAAHAARMTMEDLTERDLKQPVPHGLDAVAERRWRYQRYLTDYVRTVAAMDDNIGRLLDWLDDHELADSTMISYASDQGFFLGDHGWFDKRFVYEESLRMPMLMRWPGVVEPGTVIEEITANVDVAATLCEVAGVPAPPASQGRSMVPLLRGERPTDWRDALYYRYWMHDDPAHAVWAHYALRTERHTLVCFCADPDATGSAAEAALSWELYDLLEDPQQLNNLIDDPGHAELITRLRLRLREEQAAVGDRPFAGDHGPVTAATG